MTDAPTNLMKSTWDSLQRDRWFWGPLLGLLIVVLILQPQQMIVLVGALIVLTSVGNILFVKYVATNEPMIDGARRLAYSWGVVLLFVILTTIAAGRSQTGSTALRYEGVLIERGKAATVGVGVPGELDVRLPTPRDRGVTWQAAVNWRRGIGPELRFTNISPGVVILTCEPKPTNQECKDWRLISGSIVSAGDSVTIPEGPTLRLLRQNGIITATLGRATFDLGPSSGGDTLFTRAERLDEGVPLAILRARGSPIEAAADHVTIREVPVNEQVAERGSTRSWLRKLIDGGTKRSGRFIVQVAKGTAQTSDVLPLRARQVVRVLAGTEAWRILLDPSPNLVGDQSGVAIKYLRNPRPLALNLAAPDVCAPAQACNVISLRTLPSPTNYLYLGDIGPDTLRYRFQARAEETADSLLILTADKHFALRPNATEATAIPVQRIEVGSQSPLALLMTAKRGAIGSSGAALLAALGIVGLFLLLAQLLLRVRTVYRHPADADRSQQHSLTLIAAGFVTLALIRGILGLRVSLYSPFAERPAVTGIGIWPALAVFLTLLFISGDARGEPLPGRYNESLVTALKGALRTELSQMFRSLKRLWRSPRFQRIVLAGGAIAIVFGITLGPKSFLMSILVGAFAALGFIGTRKAMQVADAQENPAQAAGWIALLLLTQSVVYMFVSNGSKALKLFVIFCETILFILLAALLFIPKIRKHVAARNDQVTLLVAWICLSFGFVMRLPFEGNAALSTFYLVLVIVLTSIKLAERIPEGAAHGPDIQWLRWLVIFAPLCLSFLLPIDAGLVLVVMLPLLIGTYLRARIFTDATSSPQTRIAAASLLIITVGMFYSNIYQKPTYSTAASEPTELVEEFKAHASFYGLSFSPTERLAARSVALHEPNTAMRLAVQAPGGAAQSTLRKAVEQHWGTKAYAKGSGWLGEGLGSAPVGGRGIAAAVSYAENTFAVYVLGEHGLLGGLVVLTAYLLIIGGTVWYVRVLVEKRAQWDVAMEAFVGALLLALPAAYVAASNVGILPITGQNMPILGLNAWSDVIYTCLAAGLIVNGIQEGSQRDLRRYVKRQQIGGRSGEQEAS